MPFFVLMLTFKNKFFAKKWLVLKILILVACSTHAQQSLLPVAVFKNIESAAFKNIEVSSYCYTPNNTLYFGTNDGLYSLKFGKIIAIHFPIGFNKIITSILPNGLYLLIGTNDGIVQFNTINNTFTKLIIIGRLQQAIQHYCLLLSIDKKQNLLFYTGYDTSAYYTYNLENQTTTFLFNKSDAFRAYKNDSSGYMQKLWVVEPKGLAYYHFNKAILTKKESFFYGGNTGPALSITEIVYSNNIIWCSTNKGLLYFNTENNSWKIIPEKSNTPFTGIALYQQKVVCASNDGVFIYDTIVKKWQSTIIHQPDNIYSLPSNEIKKIGILKNDILLIITSKGISYLLLKDTHQITYTLPKQKSNEAVYITHNGIQGIAANKQQLFVLNKQVEIVKTINDKGIGFIKQAIPIANKAWACITNNDCFIIDSNGYKKNIIYIHDKPNNLAFIVTTDNSNQLILGGAEGLFEININQLQLKKIMLDSSVLFYYYQNGISNNGALFVNANYSYIDIFTQNKYNHFNHTGSIHTHFNILDYLKINSQQYLLACNNGLKILDVTNKRVQAIHTFFEKTIYKILTYNNDTLLFAIDGLYQLKKDTILPYLHPLSALFTASSTTKISIVQQQVIFNKEDKIYKIPVQQNAFFDTNYSTIKVFLNDAENSITQIALGKNVQVNIDVNSFQPFIEQNIEYNVNNTAEWIKVNNENFSLDRLPIGECIVTIRATVAGNNWFKKRYIIKVVPKWYQTNWFTCILGMLVFISVCLFFIIVIQYQKRKANIKLLLQKQLSTFESKALRSQMNPHFIFNTMNSINSAVISKQTDTASEYINQFSKLMRLTLENSQHECISLHKELAALQIYLQLEQFRLDYSFTFKINVDAAVDVHDCLVPPLILQPFTENSIWHGLIHMQANGKIFINITASNYCFSITITDNGIGRHAAASNNKNNKTNKSFGSNITLQRIKMMNTNNTIVITDVYNADSTVAGTKVMLAFYQSNI
jgi:Histidine kinase